MNKRNKNKIKPYIILLSKFIGYGKDGSATYEITFNKSLVHTGKFIGIENGLNSYDRKEKYRRIIIALQNLWYSIIKPIKDYEK